MHRQVTFSGLTRAPARTRSTHEHINSWHWCIEGCLFPKTWYWLARKAINVKWCRLHTHTHLRPIQFCAQSSDRSSVWCGHRNLWMGLKEPPRKQMAFRVAKAQFSPWWRSSCREPAWLGLDGGISEPGTSPLGVKDMWQFQPVSRPIFSANTCGWADKGF